MSVGTRGVIGPVSYQIYSLLAKRTLVLIDLLGSAGLHAGQSGRRFRFLAADLATALGATDLPDRAGDHVMRAVHGHLE
jgi:hypothetical protein